MVYTLMALRLQTQVANSLIAISILTRQTFGGLHFPLGTQVSLRLSAAPRIYMGRVPDLQTVSALTITFTTTMTEWIVISEIILTVTTLMLMSHLGSMILHPL